jgi:hypothetical protein
MNSCIPTEPATFAEDIALLHKLLNRYVELLRSAPRYLLQDFVIRPYPAYQTLTNKQGVYLIESRTRAVKKGQIEYR